MAFLDGFSREALAAANMQPRVGWFIPEAPLGPSDPVPLRPPAVVHDNQRVTDIAIGAELYSLCPSDEREDFVRLLGPEGSNDHLILFPIGFQRGGLHSDPMIRTIAAHAWGRRDLDWTPAQVAIDNARELVDAMERTHKNVAGYPRLALRIPPGTFEIAPLDLGAVGWPAHNWPYIYRSYLRALKITNIEGSANKYIRTRSSADVFLPMQNIPRPKPQPYVYEGPHGAQRPKRDHSPNTRLTNPLADALGKALGVHGVPPTSKK